MMRINDPRPYPRTGRRWWWWWGQYAWKIAKLMPSTAFIFQFESIRRIGVDNLVIVIKILDVAMMDWMTATRAGGFAARERAWRGYVRAVGVSFKFHVFFLVLRGNLPCNISRQWVSVSYGITFRIRAVIITVTRLVSYLVEEGMLKKQIIIL